MGWKSIVRKVTKKVTKAAKNFFTSTAGLVTTAVLAAPLLPVYGIIRWGIDIYDSQKEALRAAEEAAEAALNSVSSVSSSSSALSGDIKSLPYIRGAQNTTATGKTQPYIIGRHLFTPYILNGGGGTYQGWHRIGGELGAKEFYFVVLEGGFAPQVLESLNIGDVKAVSFNKDNGAQSGIFSFNKGSEFASGDSLVEIQQGTNSFKTSEFNSKVVEQSASSQLKYSDDDGYEPLIFTLDKNAMAVDVIIMFNGFYAVNSSGKTTKTRTVTPEWSADYAEILAGGGDVSKAVWHEFKFTQNGQASNTFTYNKQSQLRFTARAELPFDAVFSSSKNSAGNTVYKKRARPVTVRVSTTDKKDDKARADCYVQYVQSFCCNTQKSISKGYFVPESIIADREAALSVQIGVKIEATSANSDKITKISVVTNGCAPYLNTSKEWAEDDSGDFKRKPTSNIAAWTLEVLTSKTHAPSKIDAEEIDLDAFALWHAYCEENGLYVNKVLTSGATKESILSALAEAGRAVLYQNLEGRLSVAWDKVQDKPKMLFNSQNLISFSWKKDLSRQPDGVKLTFVESSGDAYETDSITRMYSQYNSSGGDQWEDPEIRDADSQIREIEGYGITDAKQAAEYMSYIMNSAHARLKEVTIETGKEAFRLLPYDRVTVQHSAIGRGEGSTRIKSVVVSGGAISGITTYEPVMMNAGENFVVEIQATGSGDAEIVEAEASVDATRGSLVAFAIPVSAALKPGDVVSYGFKATVSEDFIVKTIQPSGTGFSLTLTEYDERIFDFGKIPEYESPLSITGDIRKVNIPGTLPVVTEDMLSDTISSLVNSSEIPAAPSVSAKAEKDGIEFTCNPGGTDIFNTLAGYEVVLYKGSNASGTSVVSADSQFLYEFDRGADGYPEADALSKWTFKARAVSVYGNRSEWTDAQAVNTDTYGTWSLEPPEIRVRISDRTITLICSEPERSDSREVYGNIRYKVQVKRPDIDTSYFKPASSLDPYGLESNYKDGNGYALSDGVYIQTMPLRGQSTDNIVDTAYMFRVTAFSEAEESSESETTATAVCTSIRDIVKANETAKEAYISSLSAISANLGVISKGSLDGSDTNYWALSTVTDEQTGVKRYEGAFRVGGTDEYLKVTPVVNGRGEILKYTIEFKVGNFEVTTEATRLNGELIVQSSEDALDRTRITPQGTFYQHRESASSKWITVAQSAATGVMTKHLFSEETLVVSNQSIADRRKEGTDIGHPYLSESSHVFHFDTDLLDQNGASGVTVVNAENDGFHTLVGGDTESDDIDFTPAILAVAPYSAVAKSLYGKYALSADFGSAAKFTVDFWIQYIYAENQTLLEIGDEDDTVSIDVRNAECFYAYDEEDPTGCAYNEETTMSRMYRKIGQRGCSYLPSGYCSGGYETKAAKSFKADGKYYVRAVSDDGTEEFSWTNVTQSSWEEMVAAGLWERTIPYNSPAPSRAFVEHKGQTASERRELGKYEPNSWLHIGLLCDGATLTLITGIGTKKFARYATHDIGLSISLNKGAQSFLLDELMVDTTTCESEEDFAAHTADRIPWGALDSAKNYFVLTASEPEDIKTNLFDSSAFKTKVLEIIKEYHS